MGDFINNLIDNLIAVSWRMLDLPLYLLFLFVIVSIALFNSIAKRWLTRLSDRNRLYVNAVLVVLMLLFIIDKKFSLIRSEMTVINEKLQNSQMKVFSVSGGHPYDLTEFNNVFQNAKAEQRPVAETIQLLKVSLNQPKAVAYIARVDLSHPSIGIAITPKKKGKYLTSAFAKQNNCVLAINGEAGETMAMDAELGEWSGNWVSNGKVVMMADTKERPFIGFNQENKATYYNESFVDQNYKDAYFNAIWGRFDILKAGSVVHHDSDKPYARTIMGLDSTGSTLFLMVVDGKRPDYSIGLTYADCAKMLKSLGASDAMACDQGGSSCMYVAHMGGIINRPADSDGRERPVYSHFGIILKE